MYLEKTKEAKLANPSSGPWPCSQKEWLAYMESEEGQKELQDVEVSLPTRVAASMRIEALPGLVPCARLRPTAQMFPGHVSLETFTSLGTNRITDRLSRFWDDHVSSNSFGTATTFSRFWNNEKLVIAHEVVGWVHKLRVWGMRLQPPPAGSNPAAHGFLSTEYEFEKNVKPLVQPYPHAPPECEVLALTVEFTACRSGFLVTCTSARAIPAPRATSARRRRHQPDDEDDDADPF